MNSFICFISFITTRTSALTLSHSPSHRNHRIPLASARSPPTVLPLPRENRVANFGPIGLCGLTIREAAAVSGGHCRGDSVGGGVALAHGVAKK